ncbi:MAG: DUF2911 domain-containing protein [Terrimonas sp.]|nr:DUF2911 domain-containing protein [Terrimonas sp.]
MKKVSFVILLGFSAIFMNAQSKTPFPEADKSPMDMSYYPDNYPILKIQNKAKEPVIARVIYSRPQKNGRMVFGELLEFGKLWRLGANEATELDLYRDVKIGGKKIPKGRYTLYAIPYENKWTIIINKDTDTWGAFKYEADKDLVRTDVPVHKREDVNEFFSMVFEKNDNGFNLNIGWDDVLVTLPILL